MKPIELKIKGINSFNQLQVINFEALMSGGLFGIFGDTGSGKSSILDGISLALYGAVSRSSKEFINTNCDDGTINFKFSIKNKTYVVERTFTKKPKSNAMETTAHLYDVSTAVPLAETVPTVDDYCIKLIGLNKDDFFRTVILPQGKFSEFLNIKGAERGKMLERIFNLEEFGEKLRTKVDKALKQYKDTSNKLDGYLKGIGEVNQEECDSLKLELQTISNNLIEFKKEAKIIEQKYKKAKAIWDLQEEMGKYIAKLEELEEEKTQNEENKNQIKMAEKADLVKPHFDAKETSNQNLIEEKGKFNDLKTSLDKLVESKQEIYDNYDIAEKSKNEEIPALSTLKGSLESALDDEKTVTELTKKLTEIETTLSTISNQIEEQGKIQKAKTDEKDELECEIKKLKEHVADNTVTLDFRENINDASKVSNEVEQFLKEKKAKEQEIKTCKKAIETLNNEIVTLKGKDKELTTKLGGINLEELVKEDNLNLQKLEEALEQTQKDFRKYEIDNIVLTLQSACCVGEPCPVCGEHLTKVPVVEVVSDVDYKGKISGLKTEISELQTTITTKKDTGQNSINQINLDLNSTTKDIEQKEGLIVTEGNKIKDAEDKLNKIDSDLSDKNKELESIMVELDVADLKVEVKTIKTKDKAKESSEKQLKVKEPLLVELTGSLEKIAEGITALKVGQTENLTNKNNLIEQKDKITQELKSKFGEDYNISNQLEETQGKIDSINTAFETASTTKTNFNETLSKTQTDFDSQKGIVENSEKTHTQNIENFENALHKNSFADEEEFKAASINKLKLQALKGKVEKFNTTLNETNGALNSVKEKIGTDSITKDDWDRINNEKNDNDKNVIENTKKEASRTTEYNSYVQDLAKYKNIDERKSRVDHKKDLLGKLSKLFEGNKFVLYVASDKLRKICIGASKQLMAITNGAYKLEINKKNEFIVRHMAQGGETRSPGTLSGGETFMTSLALALALSAQIQMNATNPVELFFLDEGFGSLDDSLLDVVMDSIEELHKSDINIGVISHVERIKSRIPNKLLVEPASGSDGSKVSIEQT